MADAVAVILAAGEGQRLGVGAPKAFLSVGGPTMLELSLRAAAACPLVGSIVVTTPEGMTDAVEQVADLGVPVRGVVGGASRQASVVAALAVIQPGSATSVVVHDAARPFASPELFSRVLGALEDPDPVDGALPVIAIADTVKRVEDDLVVATESRDRLVLAQTPQAFRLEVLRAAHERAAERGDEVTDDAAALEAIGARVRVVPGEADNLKITTPTDLARAEAIVAKGGALR